MTITLKRKYLTCCIEKKEPLRGGDLPEKKRGEKRSVSRDQKVSLERGAESALFPRVRRKLS